MRILLILLLAVSLSGANDFTLVMVPDPQMMADSTRCANAANATLSNRMYNRTAQWILDNKASFDGLALNIKGVLTVGDIGMDPLAGSMNSTDSVTNTAWKVLDDAGMPYVITPGNHDYVGGSAANVAARNIGYLWTQGRFKPSTQAAKFGSGINLNDGDRAYWGGHYDDPTYTISGANTYVRFEISGIKLLVFAFEFFPRTSVLDWARTISNQYSDHVVIVTTHAHLHPNATRFQRGDSFGPNSYGMAVAPASNSGEELWNLVKVWENPPYLILSGHDVGGSRYWNRLASTATTVPRVTQQIFANCQTLDDSLDCGGNPPNGTSNAAHLFLLKFRPDSQVLEYYGVSANSGNWIDVTGAAWSTDPQLLFSVPFTPPATSAHRTFGPGTYSGATQ